MDGVVERMPHTSESVRSHFLHQLRHLSDEMDLLARRIERFPSEILDAHPSPGEPSIKEYLGSLIECDREALLRLKNRTPEEALQKDGRGGAAQRHDGSREAALEVEDVRVDSGETASKRTGGEQQQAHGTDVEETGWNSCRARDLVRGVQAGRNELVDVFEKLPHDAWDNDARENALKIIRRDTNCLRSISRRFYESTLSGRYER